MSEAVVETRRSAIAGQGLFARRDFAAGERLAPYRGPTTSTPPPRPETGEVFALEVAAGLWLDGSVADNPARWANHSCEPNAELIWHDAAEGAQARQPGPLGGVVPDEFRIRLAGMVRPACRVIGN